MPNDFITYAFAAGEISPKLWGRGDLEKYDFGCKTAINWFVDHRGGLTTRAGTEFGDYIETPGSPTKFVKFQYSPDEEDTYIILFGGDYIRFIQDNAYVLETAKNITAATKASPGVVTSASHGFSNGDWIKIASVGGMTQLNGRTFEVAGVTTNTFTLIDAGTGVAVNTTNYTTYTSGGTASRIYTLSSPYSTGDLAKLKAYQIRDTVRLTHKDYTVRNLTRTDHASWAIATETIGNSLTAPGTISVVADAGGDDGVVVAATQIDADGEESVASRTVRFSNLASYFNGTGKATFSWTALSGAVYYNVYRSIILDTDGDELLHSSPLGFIGQTSVPAFTDNNIIPDFTRTPPLYYNPFAHGAIELITMTNGGSGYTSLPSVSVSGSPGSGFVGQAVVDGGVVVGVMIRNPGSGYVSPTVSFTGGGGSSAAATATASEASGNNPAVSALFQQRQIYAATENQPLTIFGSKVGLFSNFDYSTIGNDGDSYEYDLDTPTVAPIRHLLVMRGGLIVMSQSGIWQLTGPNGGPVTSQSAVAEPQTYFGAADVTPIQIDTDILYITEKESAVRLLSYNDFSKIYGGEDMSILSNHLFKSTNRIVAWSYAEAPNRVVWAVREDGSLLSFTLVKEQKVYAWTRNQTEGFYRDVITVEEDSTDATYFAVERYINGTKMKFFERQAPREFDTIEDAICLDAALTLGSTSPATTLTVSAVTGTVTLTAGASTFTAGSVDSVVRVGGGKIIITAYTSVTVVTGVVVRDITDVIPETETPRPYASGEWTLDTPVSTVSGLWHLEGVTVKVVGDGNVLDEATVSSGAITLSAASSRVVVGLGFTAKAEALAPAPPDVILDGHRMDTLGVAVRIHETRGLQIGTDLDELRPMKDPAADTYGQPPDLRSEISYELLEGGWDENAELWFVQSNPLPASILGFVRDLEVGDDNN